MAKLLPTLKTRFLDANGAPLAGGKLYSYIAGTATPLATYTDQTEETPNTNPIILDANGEATIWIKQAYYKFILTDADDVVQLTIDDVAAVEDVVAGATTAQLAAEAARDAAEDAASEAADSALAATSASSSAATSASTASTQAGIATTKASEADSAKAAAESAKTGAEAAASTASTQAGIATTKAGEAASSASAAATSAASAAAADVPNLLTTKGDLVVRGASALARLAVGSNGQVLTADSTAPSGVAWKTLSPLSVQRITSGTSVSYAPTSGTKAIRIIMVGGGGGGSGGGVASSSSNGSAGTASIFSTSGGSAILTAGGGSGGTFGSTGAAGGTTTVNSPAVTLVSMKGNGGGPASFMSGTSYITPAGLGGSSVFGGAGNGVYSGNPGIAATANSGSGGGGGGNTAANGTTGSGGGAGGYIEAIITSPAASYLVTVGTGGTQGAAGTGTTGYAGGAGGSGIVIIEEYF